MKNEQAQRRIIAAALFSTYSSTLTPTTYEQLLAENYITGTLTIQHAIELLEDYKRKQLTAYPLPVSNVHVAAQV
jgi:hypothetical protein